MAKQNADSFEKSLQTLESLVDKLEQGELTLEESLKQFEQGVKLTRRCQSALDNAEQKVEVLLKKTETGSPEKFSGQDDTPGKAG